VTTPERVLCGLCGHRSAEGVALRSRPISFVCFSCQERLAAFIERTDRSTREHVWIVGPRVADQAVEADQATGAQLPVWADFLKTIDDAVSGGTPLLEAGARIDLGRSLIQLGMVDEAICELGQAIRLTTEPRVRAEALTHMLDATLVHDFDGLKALLFPA
jgi:hypothetical protein